MLGVALRIPGGLEAEIASRPITLLGIIGAVAFIAIWLILSQKE